MKIKFKCPEQTVPAIETIMTYENGMSIGYVKEKFNDWKGQQISGFMLMFDNQEEMDKLLNNPVNNWPPLCDSSSNPSTVTLYSGSIESTEPVDLFENNVLFKLIELYGEYQYYGQDLNLNSMYIVDQMLRSLCRCEYDSENDEFMTNPWYDNWVYMFNRKYEGKCQWEKGIRPVYFSLTD